MSPDVYRKRNSFVDLVQRAPLAGVLDKIDDLRTRLDGLGLPPERKAVVYAACGDLLEPDDQVSATQFRFEPYVVHEISRLADQELPRYLYYRYRYEMNPERKVLDEFPPCLQVEPTSICNYRCVFCYQTDSQFTSKQSGQMGLMSLDRIKAVIDQAAGNCEAITMASRGEPMMHRDIAKMLAYASGKFLALKINTNAWYLDDANCHAILQADVNTLVFSADAASEPAYSQLRVNGRLDRVLDNVKRFRDIRAKQYPRARVITRVSGVSVPNTPNLEEMEAAWGELVDQVAFVAYNPWENTYQRPVNDITTACSDLWRRMFIWWDGTANPCDVDYRSTLAVSKAPEASVGDLWRSAKYAELRERHLSGRRSDCSPCNRCTLI